MNYNTKQSGERIRLLRIRAGLTQEKTANALNIDQSYYGRIETGKKGCSVDLFIQLAELFDGWDGPVRWSARCNGHNRC